MQPELDIGPLTLQTFGICFAVAFLLAGGLVARRLEEIGEPPDWSYELIFCALVGGLVGARVDYLIQNWSDVSDDLLGSIFSGSGLVWLGGLIGGALGVVLWAWWRGFLGLELLDLCAPGLALGYAVGRVGCQLSGDGDYGEPVGPAVGDGLPGGHGRRRRGGAPDADLRDAGDGPRRARPVAAARPLPAGRAVRASTW